MQGNELFPNQRNLYYLEHDQISSKQIAKVAILGIEVLLIQHENKSWKIVQHKTIQHTYTKRGRIIFIRAVNDVKFSNSTISLDSTNASFKQ